MLFHILLLATLGGNPCANEYITGEKIYSFEERGVLQAIDTLPRTPEFLSQVGILFTIKVFAQISKKPRVDADSSLFYLGRADAVCPQSVTLDAYLCAARLLQAQYLKQHEILHIFDTLHLYFGRLDSLAIRYPENLAVQFVAGCVFQNAPRVWNEHERYWYKSGVYLARLDSLATLEKRSSGFFTREVRANIKLNLAHLQGKTDDQTAKNAQLEGLQLLIATFPETWAARHAARIIQEKILVAPTRPPENVP